MREVSTLRRTVSFTRLENCSKLNYPRNFRALTTRFTMPYNCEFEGESRMRDRVIPSGGKNLAHAQRLKKALDRGAPPSFLHRENVLHPTYEPTSNASD